ncbi:MAG: hypothetical protein M3R02_05190, partial [Chloroflexota bacterium]|nr:hypothetical protein [Chloroflexota bacterium]
SRYGSKAGTGPAAWTMRSLLGAFGVSKSPSLPPPLDYEKTLVPNPAPLLIQQREQGAPQQHPVGFVQLAVDRQEFRPFVGQWQGLIVVVMGARHAGVTP